MLNDIEKAQKLAWDIIERKLIEIENKGILLDDSYYIVKLIDYLVTSVADELWENDIDMSNCGDENGNSVLVLNIIANYIGSGYFMTLCENIVKIDNDSEMCAGDFVNAYAKYIAIKHTESMLRGMVGLGYPYNENQNINYNTPEFSQSKLDMLASMTTMYNTKPIKFD